MLSSNCLLSNSNIILLSTCLFGLVDTVRGLSRCTGCWCLLFAGVDLYTVKRLESDDFEVEFPCADYLPLIRDQLDKRYPTLKWHDNACKQEAILKVARPGLTLSTGRYRVRVPSCQLIVQLGSAVIGERRLWVSDVKASSSCQQYAGGWIDSELCHIYRSAHQSLQQQQQQLAEQLAASPSAPVIWWRHSLRHRRRRPLPISTATTTWLRFKCSLRLSYLGFALYFQRSIFTNVCYHQFCLSVSQFVCRAKANKWGSLPHSFLSILSPIQLPIRPQGGAEFDRHTDFGGLWAEKHPVDSRHFVWVKTLTNAARLLQVSSSPCLSDRLALLQAQRIRPVKQTVAHHTLYS